MTIVMWPETLGLTLFDMQMQEVCRSSYDWIIPSTPERAFSFVREQAMLLLQQADIRCEDLYGVSLSTSGIVDYDNLILKYSVHSPEWGADVPVGTYLAEIFGSSTYYFIENAGKCNYLESDKVGDSVVVLGGGLAGCECAVHLGMEGKKVHIVEMRDSLAVDCNIRHRPILMQQVDKYTTVHLNHTGLQVTEEGLLARNAEGEEVLIPGATVICAVGQRSNRDDVLLLRGCAPWVREIGDCVRVSNITNAMYMAYHAGLDI